MPHTSTGTAKPTETDDTLDSIRAAVRGFVQKECDEWRCLVWDRERVYPKPIFDRIAQLGWYGIGIPEQDGGSGGSQSDLLVVAEELGRGSTDLVACFSLTASGLRTIIRNGSAEQKSQLVPALMNGSRRLSIAVTEPESGSDAAALLANATRDGENYVVNGQKTFCEAAGLPDTLIQLYVRTDPMAKKKQHGISMLLLDPTAAGVTLRRLPMMGRNITGVYEVFLDDVKVPVADRVGVENEGWRELGAELPLERLIISAGFVGATMQVLDDTLRYVKEREQFGRPIGTFQSVAHLLVDLFTRAESTRLLVRHGGELADANVPFVKEASMAKTASSELYADAARYCMQLHGSYGYIEEHPLSMHYTDSVIATVAGGSSQVQRNIVAAQLGLRV
ncbi:acyl-CoA dehydrogenase family protein [Rathayibacter soli]|uniref:acyl-CoA dehydrogenase family protein n=1 Tax=Rathayibacter soli TaxID=3144168 RepID=UPI0027E3C9D5|nr:acyl-CoA dehydrogenase family protein [Glaciibacter superstes]